MVKTVMTIQDCRQPGVSDNFMTAALDIRWKCMGMLDAEPASKTIINSKGNPIIIMPKRFTLTPQCKHSPRFITLDNQYFRIGLGLSKDASEEELADPALAHLAAPAKYVLGAASVVRHRKKHSTGPFVFPPSVRMGYK
jgi:hypothetical protein